MYTRDDNAIPTAHFPDKLLSRMERKKEFQPAHPKVSYLYAWPSVKGECSNRCVSRGGKNLHERTTLERKGVCSIRKTSNEGFIRIQRPR